MPNAPLIKLKAWIIYAGGNQWFNASLVLENGWVPYAQVCSCVEFMAGDLYLNRKDRQQIFEDLGYEIEVQGAPMPAHQLPTLVSANYHSGTWSQMVQAYAARLAQKKVVS